MTGPMQKLMKYLMRAGIVVFVPLGGFSLPASIYTYMFGSSLYGLMWALLLRTPRFRVALGLPAVAPKVEMPSFLDKSKPPAPKLRFVDGKFVSNVEDSASDNNSGLESGATPSNVSSTNNAAQVVEQPIAPSSTAAAPSKKAKKGGKKGGKNKRKR